MVSSARPPVSLPTHLSCHCKNRCWFSFPTSSLNCFTSATASSFSMYFLSWGSVSQTSPDHCNSGQTQCSWNDACEPRVIFSPHCSFSDPSWGRTTEHISCGDFYPALSSHNSLLKFSGHPSHYKNKCKIKTCWFRWLAEQRSPSGYQQRRKAFGISQGRLCPTGLSCLLPVLL